MTFFSVLFALFAEQYRPVGRDHWIGRVFRQWVYVIPNYCDTGEPTSAKISLFVLLFPPVFFVFLVHLWLIYHYPLFALGWNIVIVYFCMGFRQFSHPFTLIQEALRERQLDTARQELANWAGPSLVTENMSETEVVRHTLERAILAVHKHVFGVFFWFLLPIGPAGVILYRLTILAEEHWRFGAASPALIALIKNFREVIDWLPTRLTATGFTIVGNFEQAAYAWRFHQKKWVTQSEAILIGTGGGALGVQLGEPIPEVDSAEAIRMAEQGEHPVHEFGMLPLAAHLDAGASLVWRAVVLWMILLAMLTIAVWIGPI